MNIISYVTANSIIFAIVPLPIIQIKRAMLIISAKTVCLILTNRCRGQSALNTINSYTSASFKKTREGRGELPEGTNNSQRMECKRHANIKRKQLTHLAKKFHR